MCIGFQLYHTERVSEWGWLASSWLVVGWIVQTSWAPTTRCARGPLRGLLHGRQPSPLAGWRSVLSYVWLYPSRFLRPRCIFSAFVKICDNISRSFSIFFCYYSSVVNCRRRKWASDTSWRGWNWISVVEFLSVAPPGWCWVRISVGPTIMHFHKILSQEK